MSVMEKQYGRMMTASILRITIAAQTLDDCPAVILTSNKHRGNDMHGIQKKSQHNEGTDDRWRRKGHAFTSKSYSPTVCTHCGGSGTYRDPVLEGFGATTCGVCKGMGEI